MEALPPNLREQIEQKYSLQQEEACKSNKKEPVNGYSTSFPQQPVGAVLLQIPDLQESSNDAGINVIALPAFSQVNYSKFIPK